MPSPVKETKVVTGIVRLSYAHIWQPTSIDESGEPKYSVAIIIPKSDKKTIKKIKDAVDAAIQAGISKFGGKIPVNLKLPLRDGDEDHPDDDAYANSYFVNANSRTKPGIVDKDCQPILDSDEVYSGCYARVSVNFYAFNTSGNKGIACGLNNIMKVRDGEPLGGRSRAEDDFSDDFDYGDDDDDLLG